MIKNNNEGKSIAVIGCGGTSSWLIQMLSKFDFDNIPCIVCNEDLVKQRNCLRQDFNYDNILDSGNIYKE